MTIKDITILVKKILIGIIVYLIPVQIIFGGLWLTNQFLKKDNSEKKELTEPTSIPTKKLNLKN